MHFDRHKTQRLGGLHDGFISLIPLLPSPRDHDAWLRRRSPEALFDSQRVVLGPGSSPGCFVPFLTAFMFRAPAMLLDHVREKFAVGATTFVLQVPTHTFGSAILTRTPKPVPALQLSEVAFSVYYPTHSGLSTKKYRYLDWVVRWGGFPWPMHFLGGFY